MYAIRSYYEKINKFVCKNKIDMIDIDMIDMINMIDMIDIDKIVGKIVGKKMEEVLEEK